MLQCDNDEANGVMDVAQALILWQIGSHHKYLIESYYLDSLVLFKTSSSA